MLKNASKENIAQAQAQSSEIKARKIAAFDSSSKAIFDEDQTQFQTLIDAESATLADVSASGDSLNANMVMMIEELDQQVNGMGDHLGKLQQATFGEKLIGMFSDTKAKSMREERIRSNSLEDNLNDTLQTSSTIVNMLEEQKVVQTEQLEIGKENHRLVSELRVANKTELKENESKIAESAQSLNMLKSDIELCEDAPAKAKLEDELRQKTDAHNLLVDHQKVLTSRDQNLDRLVNIYNSAVESMTTQLSNQKVMIDKLKTDTHHRAIIIEQYLASIKTNEQQATAHKINKIGTNVDASIKENFDAFKKVSNDQFAQMLEEHDGDMNRLLRSDESMERADNQFRERFGKVIEKQRSTAN